jgi:polyisoprenoid-binding protein YceI
MRHLACTLLAAALLPAPAAVAASWTVDKAASRLGFAGTQTGTPFEGRFTSWDARIEFDPARPEAGSAVVTIDVASATTGDAQRDAALPQPEWLDAATSPEAVFETTSFRPRGGNAYEAVGTLSLRDIRREVVLPFTLDVQGDTAVAKGRLDLIRTDFGVGQGPWASGQWVALEVAATLDLLAKRAD